MRPRWPKPDDKSKWTKRQAGEQRAHKKQGDRAATFLLVMMVSLVALFQE